MAFRLTRLNSSKPDKKPAPRTQGTTSPDPQYVPWNPADDKWLQRAEERAFREWLNSDW